MIGERPTISDLMRCRVETVAGRRVGHLHELRCDGRDGDPPIATTLLVGPGGLLARLGLGGRVAREIPWAAVVDVRPGRIVVADDAG